MSKVIKAADLFCGGGGTSQGAEQSGAARVVCAVNHYEAAGRGFTRIAMWKGHSVSC